MRPPFIKRRHKPQGIGNAAGGVDNSITGILDESKVEMMVNRVEMFQVDLLRETGGAPLLVVQFARVSDK